MIMERVKEGQETIEFKWGKFYTKQETLRLTTRDNDISINVIRTLCRQHKSSCRKIIKMHK